MTGTSRPRRRDIQRRWCRRPLSESPAPPNRRSKSLLGEGPESEGWWLVKAGPTALGLAFGFGWTPCIGPVLGAILTLSAVSTTTGGVGLLGAYALGLGVPFLASALFLDRAARLLREARRLGQLLQVAGGLLLIALGIAMITGWLTAFSLWLIDTFPALRAIG